MSRINQHNIIISWFLKNVGYLTTVKLKDFVLFLTGILIGGILMMLRLSKFLYRVEKVENLGNITSFSFKRKGITHYCTQFRDVQQIVEFLTLMIAVPFKKRRAYTINNRRRTRIIVFIVFLGCILLCILSIIFIFNPIVNP